MKFFIVFIITTAVLWTSCASSSPADSGSRQSLTGTEAAAQPAGRVVKVPVEKKAFFKFSGGVLDEYVVSQYDSGDVNLSSQSKYSASNALIEKVDYKYQNDRLETKTTIDGMGSFRSLVRYQYNDRGQIIREIVEDKDGKPVTSNIYNYDADGNRISRVINDAAGAKLAETTFVFNNGQLVSTETRDAGGKLTGSSESTFDNAGNRITERVFNSSGEVIRIIESSWLDGLEVSSERKTGKGQLQRSEKFEYGSSGELLRIDIEDIQNKSNRIVEYEYTFREDRS